MDGAGVNPELAAAAAAEIGALGGVAYADSNDVSTEEGAAAVVERAISEYGQLDILISNAGIFEMKPFTDVTFEDLERHLRVHVGGSFNVARAAWPHLVESARGRVVMTTSTGALGDADLVAYGTAKAAVIGLARALAVAGAPAAIKVNLVAPMALTRMMTAGMAHAGLPAPAQDPGLAPDLVAPLVALLAHDACPSTGEMYVGGMRRYTRMSLTESQGYVHPIAEVTIEDLVAHWSEIASDDGIARITDASSWAARHQAALASV
jgi:NAD(P)-dependent dehydrogenase (short-subunit alcohol dehydrogenase family)